LSDLNSLTYWGQPASNQIASLVLNICDQGNF
jgi:hypothetical protein